MVEDLYHSFILLNGRLRPVVTIPDIDNWGRKMDDKACKVCGRSELHSHSDEDIQSWERELNRSVSRHPAGRKIIKRIPPKSR